MAIGRVGGLEGGGGGGCHIYESKHDTWLPCCLLTCGFPISGHLPCICASWRQLLGNKVLIMAVWLSGVWGYHILSFALHSSSVFELRCGTGHAYGLHWCIQGLKWILKKAIHLHSCIQNKTMTLCGSKKGITQAIWHPHCDQFTPPHKHVYCWPPRLFLSDLFWFGWLALHCRHTPSLNPILAVLSTLW